MNVYTIEYLDGKEVPVEADGVDKKDGDYVFWRFPKQGHDRDNVLTAPDHNVRFVRKEEE